jgi:hypothetical protein
LRVILLTVDGRDHCVSFGLSGCDRTHEQICKSVAAGDKWAENGATASNEFAVQARLFRSKPASCLASSNQEVTFDGGPPGCTRGVEGCGRYPCFRPTSQRRPVLTNPRISSPDGHFRLNPAQVGSVPELP